MNELYINANVYWKTKKDDMNEAFSELCAILNKYEIELDMVFDMELKDENGIEIKE